MEQTDFGADYAVSYNYIVGTHVIYIDLGDDELYLSRYDLIAMLEALDDQE